MYIACYLSKEVSLKLILSFLSIKSLAHTTILCIANKTGNVNDL